MRIGYAQFEFFSEEAVTKAASALIQGRIQFTLIPDFVQGSLFVIDIRDEPMPTQVLLFFRGKRVVE